MQKPGFLNTQLSAEELEAVQSKKQMSEYDAGLTAQDTEPVPTVDINIPEEPSFTEIPSVDGKYGFVDRHIFDEPEVKESPVILGHNPYNNANLHYLGIGDYHDESTRIAAMSSDLGETQDFSAVGKLSRSIIAGVGSQIFTASADVIDWAESVRHLASGTEDTGRSIYDEKTEESRYQMGENITAGEIITPAFAGNIFEYFTGIDPTKSFTDTLRKIGASLETVDDQVEENFRNEYGDAFIKRDAEGNIDISYEQLFVADFWLTKAAKQIPNMALFAFGGYGGGVLAGKTYLSASNAYRAYKGVKAGTALVKASPLIVRRSFVGSEVARAGFKFFGHRFTGLGTAKFFGAGLGSNLPEGAVLAGEAYKQGLADGLTKDQAATVGLRVMRDNANWLMVDALKFSILDKGIRGIGLKMRSADALKLGKGVTFKTGITDFLIGSGLVVANSKIEELQEVYQDWRIKTHLANMKGEEFMSYTDYFNSPDVAETRVVSAAVGGFMSGAGVMVNVIKDIANSSSNVDDKIDSSGFGENGEGLLIANAYSKINSEGTKSGDFTAEEVIVNEKHKVVESVITSAVANGEQDLAADQIQKLIELNQTNPERGLTKEEGEAAIALMNEMSEAFKPFESINIKDTEKRKYRKEAARMAYYISMEKNIMEETKNRYEAQIEAINNDDTMTDERKGKQIQAIQEEIATAEEMTMGTIEGYYRAIDQIQSDAMIEAVADAAAVDAKNNNKRESMAKAQTEQNITKERMDDSRAKKIKEKTDKLTPKQRESRKKFLNKKLSQVNEQISKTNNIISTKGSKSNLTQKKKIYKTKGLDGENVIVEILYKADGSREFRYKTADGQLINTARAGKDNTLSDEEYIKNAIADEVEPELVEEITDVNKLYSKKIIESQGLENTNVEKLEEKKADYENELNSLNELEEVQSKQSESVEEVKKDTEANNKRKQKPGDPKDTPPSGDGRLYQLEDEKTEEESAEEKEDDYRVAVDGTIVKDRHYGVDAIFRERLRKKGINLTVYDHFAKTQEGKSYYGIAQGLSIYINSNKATQETFFHELAHVYLMEFWDSPAVKALREVVLGQPVFNKTKQSLRNKIVFNNNGNLQTFEELVHSTEGILVDIDWKEKNPDKGASDYIDYVVQELKKKGIDVLPDSEQREILEESVVELIAKSKDSQDLNGLIDLKKKKTAESRMKRAWKSFKKKFSKEDQDEIFKNTNNESLVDNKDILNEVIKDYDRQTTGKDGKFNFRRERKNFSGKMGMPGKDTDFYDNKEMGGIVQDLFDAYEKHEEVRMRLSKDSEGEYTAAAKEKYRAWVLDTYEKVKEDIEDMYKTKKIDSTLWNNWIYESGISKKDNPNQRRYLNQVIRRKIGGGVKTEWSDVVDEESWLDRFLDTRVGQNETISKWVKSFAKMMPSIKGFRDTERLVRKYIWLSMNSINGAVSEEEFVNNVNHLIKKWNSVVLIDGKSRQNKEQGMSLKDEVVVRYAMYIQQFYKNNGWDSENAFNEIYQDTSSYKKISWLSYFKNFAGETTLKPHKGTQLIHGRTYDKAQNDNGEKIKSIFQKDFKNINPNSIRGNSWLQYISNVMDLQKEMQKSPSIEEKRKSAAKFLYKHFVDRMEDVKDDIESFEDLLDSEAVNEIVSDNAEELIKQTARIQMSRDVKNNSPADVKGRILNWLGEQLNESQKKFSDPSSRYRYSQGYWLDKTDKQNIKDLYDKSLGYYKEDGQNYGKTNIWQGIQRGNDIKNPFAIPILKTIIESITQAQSEARFDAMIKMPGGEMTANISKSNQVDRLIKDIVSMQNTTEGKARLQLLFAGNPIIERMLKDGEVPVIKQVIGGNLQEIVSKIGKRRRGFDSGDATANEMADMHISLINEAIKKNNKTYSQSISVFGDKSTELHLTNAKLYTLTEARSEANKINKELAQEYVKNIKQYLRESRSETLMFIKEPIAEQIALNYFINKHHAKDLFIGPKSYFKNSGIGNEGIKDYVKRAAGAIAGGIEQNDIRFEPIILKDVMLEIQVEGKDKPVKINMTDGCTLMLESDGNIISEKAGNARPLGNHYKFVYYGQNLDNTTLEKKVGLRHPIYMKTNTFRLTENFVKNNPKYAAAFEALLARKKHTQTSSKTTIPIIVFESAMKVTGESVGGINKKMISYQSLEEMIANDTFNKHQNDLFYFSDLEGDKFGLDGSYMRVQTELDRASKDGKGALSKQLTFMLYSNPELMDKANNVMRLIVDAFKDQSSKAFSNLGGRKKHYSQKRLKSILYRVFDKADADVFGPSTMRLLEKGSLDSGTLGVIKNIITKTIIKSSTKFRAPGGLGVEMTDFGVRVSREGMGVSDGLNHYIIKDGEIVAPAEIIIDSSTAKSLGLVVGDRIIVQRIPTSKLGDAVVCKVVQITEGMGTMAAISAETSSILGSDQDGDGLHIVGKHPGSNLNESQQKWNTAFEKLSEFLMLKENLTYTQKGINELDGYMKKRMADIKEKSEGVAQETIDDLSILGNRNLYLANRGSQEMIGYMASFNNGHKVLSSGGALGIELNTVIDNDVVGKSYRDKGNTWLDLAYMLNMFLDDANKAYASNVNLNKHTFNITSELVSRGVPLSTAITIINHPFVKKLVNDARLYNDTITNQALRSLGPKKQFSSNRIEAMKFFVRLNPESKDFYKDNESTNKSLANLIIKTNDTRSMNQLDAIRQLASLDSRMPSTTAEGLELVDSVLNLAMGVRKGKEGMEESFLDVSNILSIKPGVDLKTIKERIFDNDLKFLRQNIVFNSPVLENNFNTLTKLISDMRKLDPAYTGGFYSVINKIFPLQYLYTAALESGMNKKQKIRMIENVENRLRSLRLMQSDVYKNINPSAVLTDLTSDIQIDEEIMSPKEIEELTSSFVTEELPLAKTFDQTIEHIKSIKKDKGFEYFDEFMQFETINKENRGGYIVGKEEGYANLGLKDDGVASELVLPELTHKSREEYIMKPNVKKLQNTPTNIIENLFNKLPKKYQDFLYIYDLVINNNFGPNRLYPYLHGEMKSKVIEEIQNQVVNSEQDMSEGALSRASIEQMSLDVLVNNKDSVLDVTNRIKKWKKDFDLNIGYWDGLQSGVSFYGKAGLKIESEQTKGIPYGSVVKLTLNTSNDVRTSVLYKTSTSPLYDEKNDKAYMVLTPVLPSFKTDKTVPSKDKPTRDSRDRGRMYMLEDDKVFVKSRYNSLGKTKDGQEIIDQDGRFGSTRMYMLVEEEEVFNESNHLNVAEYARLKGEGDYDALSPKAQKKWDEEHAKYVADLEQVEWLKEKYLNKDANGFTDLENQYSSKNISDVIKDEIYPLDEIARRGIYNTMVKVLAAKAAIESIDNIIKMHKDNPKLKGLTDQEVIDYMETRERIRKGDKTLKDASYGKIFMDPDITNKEMREVGEMIREIEEYEMQYQRELTKIKAETNKSFDALLKDRFKGGIIPWWLKKLAYKYIPKIQHLKIMNKQIFKNICYEKEDIDKDGNYIRILDLMDYKDNNGNPSEAKMDAAGLSKAEKAYYRMFVKYTKMFESHLSQKTGTDGMPLLKDKTRKLYIPNRSAGWFETMAMRNMTATFIAFNYDNTLREVMVSGVNPLNPDGGKVTESLGWFINKYKIAQSGEGWSMSDFKRRKSIAALQKQAQRKVKRGDAVKVDKIQNFAEAEKFNRYLSGRSKKAGFSASHDIHSSLNKYIEANLFSHGLETQKGFKFKGAMDLLPLVDGLIAYNSFKGNPAAKKWIQELWKDRWIFSRGKKSLIGDKETHIDTVFKHLMGWTMFVGLALAPAVGASNILVGKVNEYRRSGFWSMRTGERRWWGEMYRSKSGKNNKVYGITDYFGLLQNSTDMMTEGFWTGPISNILFFFMTASESYIQRAAFAAQLSEAEWNSFEMKDGELNIKEGMNSVEKNKTNEQVFEALKKKASEMKYNVYSVQGKGYTRTDQRLLQNYFILEGLLQFKRWFPTFVMDRLGNERINRFGKKEIGSLTATLEFAKDIWGDDGVTGIVDIRKWGKNHPDFQNLPKHKQDAIKKFIRGGKATLLVAGLLFLGGWGEEDDDDKSFVVGKLEQLFSDMLLLGNIKRLQYMAAPPLWQTGQNLTAGFSNLLTNARYQRDTKYFEKDDPKFKGNFIRLLPRFMREAAFENKD